MMPLTGKSPAIKGQAILKTADTPCRNGGLINMNQWYTVSEKPCCTIGDQHTQTEVSINIITLILL
jgi:hypothetical protein